MSILTRHSVARPYPLQGPQGEAPAWAASTEIKFLMKDVPALTEGRLANYMPAIVLTAFGTLTSDAEEGEVRWKDIIYALFASFDVIGAWHGRPVSSQHVLGEHAEIWEQIAMGYQPGSRRPSLIAASSVAKNFRVSLYIPLSFLLGDDPLYSSQLSVLYNDAQFIINTRAAAVAGPSGDVTTIAGATLRASAVLVPDDAIRLAAGHEWLLFRQPGANASSDPVTLDSLGNATALQGVQPGSAIDTMLLLTSQDAQGGAFLLNQLTQFSCAVTGASQTRHLDPFIQMWEQASGAGQRTHDAGGFTTGGDTIAVNDMSGLPYSFTETGDGTNTVLPAKGLFFPIIVAGSRLQATKLPRYEGSQTFYRQLSGATGSGVDLTLCHQWKSWSPSQIEDFRQLIVSKGIAKAVLGTENLEPIMAYNDPTGANAIASRFLPIEWRAAVKKAA